MRTRRGTLAAALAAVLLGAAAARAAKPDSWITATVKARLAAEKELDAFGARVETREGVVTLRGEVGTRAEKELAGKLAEGIEGVRRVDNRLVVEEAPGRGEVGDFDRGETAPGDGAAVRGWGDRALSGIDDSAITARVRSALAGTRGMRGFKPRVNTRDGHVVLTGEARTESERELAGEVAKGVNGVKSVENRITVR